VDEKTLLRREIKRLKGLQTEGDCLRKSATVWEKIEAMPRFERIASALLYWSISGELHTHDFIRRWSRDKTIILPVVDGDRLRLVQFEGEQSLRRNAAMNLYEPLGNDFSSPQSIELAIVPGIAFDRLNHRMGRGRGYYDRLLPRLHTYNIGVCFDFQMFNSIPFGEYDVPMNEVVVG
jgi:5-formyltetrahydrofolate cyclo-ligase